MAKRRRFTLVLAAETLEQLDAIDRKHHLLLQRVIHEQLSFTPESITRNRKPLEQPAPYGATWELRCGPQNRFRVFYEVDATSLQVNVLAVGVKERERRLFAGEEYTP